MLARREWQDILKVMKNLQSRFLYLARISFRLYGEIKSFSDEQKLNFSNTNPAIKYIVKELL